MIGELGTYSLATQGNSLLESALISSVLGGVVGAVVAGIISGIVNYFSLKRQDRLNREHKQWMERFQWRRETNAIVRQLRREALQLNLSEPDTELISELIQDLETQIDLIPASYSGTPLNSALNDILLEYHDFEDADDNYSVVDLRTGLVDATEAVEAVIDDPT